MKADRAELTTHQEKIVAAVRDADGNLSVARSVLGSEYVSQTIYHLRQDGRLPADVAEMVDAWRERRGSAPSVVRPKLAKRQPARQTDLALVSDLTAAEREGIARIVARDRENRERPPAQTEKTGETFEERRVRIARERADATWRERHPEGVVG